MTSYYTLKGIKSGRLGNIMISKNRENFPDAWIKPEESVCVEIKAAELVTDEHTANNWAAGYTLRFPRVERFRKDKGTPQRRIEERIEKNRTATPVWCILS